jgi:hypothetical protein
VDPPTSEAALQTEFVKFRLRPDQKVRLMQAAADGDTSVSAILRRAALAVSAERAIGAPRRSDLVAMRVVANELAAAVEATTADPDGTMARIRTAAKELHRLAARQLGVPR